MPDNIEEERRTATDTLSLDQKLNKFKIDIINDADDLSEQRDKANAAMRFINVAGGMWEGLFSDSWDSRTKMEFDQTSDFVYRFVGEWDQNRVGVEFKPEDGNIETTDDDANLLNGIYKADYRDENGKLSTNNAVWEVAVCGFGCYKLATRFNDEEDAENELQRSKWVPVHNAYNMVYFDRASKWINKRDARRCTLLETYTPDSFREAYPGESPVSAYTPHTRSYNDFSIAKKSTIYIATRYEIVRKKTVVHVYGNLSTNQVEVYTDEDLQLVGDELRNSKIHKKIREREIIKQTVEKSIFSGEKFLKKPHRIPGKYIPIIPMYGYRSYVDGREHWHGFVQKLMDPQRLLNMQVSQLAENSASSGQEVPIFDPDQMPKQIADLWADRNNKPYMLAKSLTDQEGNIIQHGPLGYLKPPQLDGSTAALLQIVPQHIQQVTGGAPQDTLDPDASGKAILALQKRENLKTQTVMTNISNAIEWSGEVWRHIAEEIYNTKRMMRVLGDDGSESNVQLLKEVVDEKTGKVVIGNSISGKKFKAYSDVGPAYETLREQRVEEIKGMIGLLIKAGEVGQKYIPILTNLMLEDMSGPGMQQLKDIVRKDMILQGMKKPETDEEKNLLVQIQEQQNQPKPQDQLIQAATDQAASEGKKFKAEARNLDSKSIDNVASARKKSAETRKILAEIGHGDAKALNDLIKLSLDRAKSLPFQGQGQ